MSNVSWEAPATGAAGGRGIIAHVGTFFVLLAFALLAFAHLGNATESEVPAAVPTDGKTVEVIISNFTFTPNELTIAPGTTVKWINHDDIPHLVAENALAFKSQALDTNDSFSFTFIKPGDVEYFCVLHPHMTGKITVKARLPVVDRAVATSGAYGFRFEPGRFNHLFDPTTGACACLYRSMTTVADTATAADALSTAFSLMPRDRIQSVMRSAGIQMVYLIDAVGTPSRLEA